MTSTVWRHINTCAVWRHQPCTCGVAEEVERIQRAVIGDDALVAASDMIHDEHGPAAPQAPADIDRLRFHGGGALDPMSLGETHRLMMQQAEQEAVQRHAALKAHLLDAQRQRPATEPLGGMGRDELRNYFDLIVKTLNANVLRLQEAERIMAGIADRLDRIEERLNTPADPPAPTHDDDPTVRAIASLRAKGLA